MEFFQDMRHAARGLANSRGFAAMAIVTLALGIAGNATIFSTVKGLLFQMPPVEKPAQMARLWASNTGSVEDRILPSLPDFLEWKSAAADSFSGMAASRWASYTLAGPDNTSTRVWAEVVSPGYLAMLRISPAVGRDFTADDSKPGAEPAVILGHGIWQSQFGGDRSIVGRTISLNQQSYSVVGVMPGGVWFPSDDEGKKVLLPMTLDPAQMKRGAHNTMIFARLRDGVSKQQAQAELDAIAKRQEHQYPSTNSGWSVHVIPLRDEMIKRAGMGITMLFGPVIFVLLIACANVGNMLLARASARRSEIAVRAALGASRARLLRQLLTESLLLAAAAGALGVLLAWQGTRLLAFFASRALIRAFAVPVLDGAVLGFAAAVSLVTVLLFGLTPALHATRVDLVAALKERESGTGADRSARRKRDALIVFEVTLAIVFLMVTAMVTRMMMRVQSALSNPGFNMANLIVVPVEIPDGYRAPARAAQTNRQILESVRAVPGAQSAGASDGLDIEGSVGAVREIFVPGAPGGSGASMALSSSITSGFLEAIQIPLLRGRTFTSQDSAASPTVAVVSDGMARRYWPGGDALGKTLKFGKVDSNEPWLTVVGVVGDIRTPFGRVPPRVYLPVGQNDGRATQLVVRTTTPPTAIIPALKDAVRRVDRKQALEDVQSALNAINDRLRGGFFMAGLIGSFAGLALLLSAAGIYGVMSYNVTERRREIGVRMALGARAGQVLRQLVGRALALMAAGLLLGGLPPAAYALLSMNRYKWDVTRGDVLMVSAVCLSLMACGFLAAFIPAYRATRVDPMVALRCE